jgi:hypothetical protein
MEDLGRRWRSLSPRVIPSSCCLMRSMPEAGSKRRCRTPLIETNCLRLEWRGISAPQSSTSWRGAGAGSFCRERQAAVAGAIHISQPDVYEGQGISAPRPAARLGIQCRRCRGQDVADRPLSSSSFFRGESVDLVGSCRSKSGRPAPRQGAGRRFQLRQGRRIGARWRPGKARHTRHLRQMPVSLRDWT